MLTGFYPIGSLKANDIEKVYKVEDLNCVLPLSAGKSLGIDIVLFVEGIR